MMTEVKMAEKIPKADRYVCATQDGFNPTRGPLPEGTIVLGGPNEFRVMVGDFNLIPRWNTRISPSPLVLYYYLDKSTFGDAGNRATEVEELLKQASKLWNDINFGIIFEAATDKTKAHFDVVYEKNGPLGTAAMAFFPNKVEKLYIYETLFSSPAFNYQKLNSVTHELGHVLGLRHEHAAVNEGGAVRIGVINPNSIIGYQRETRSLQESDKAGLKEFYKLRNGEVRGGIPVVDYPPNFLQR